MGSADRSRSGPPTNRVTRRRRAPTRSASRQRSGLLLREYESEGLLRLSRGRIVVLAQQALRSRAGLFGQALLQDLG
jgi:hypothetical protein